MTLKTEMMASSASATPQDGPRPLAAFTRISKLASLYRADDKIATRSSPRFSSGNPKLIVVGGWMDARDAHLAKYTAGLHAIYPNSSILVVRSFMYHFTIQTGAFPREIAPVVPVIRSIIGEVEEEEEANPRGPQLLFHLFSNGGSTMLRHLYDLFEQSARPGESPWVPPHVTVLDSAPGRWSYRRTVTAFEAGLTGWTKILFRTLLHLLFSFYWCLGLLSRPLGRKDSLEKSYLAHNDRGRNKTEARRTYIYSEEDKLIDWKDVEQHAAAARERGYVTRLEKFHGSAHVAHMRKDEQRYWRVIEETWKEAQ